MRNVLLILGAAVLSLTAAKIAHLPERPEDTAAVPDIALAPLASGIGPITSIANAGDARLFLTLQTGKVAIFSAGEIRPAAFLDLTPFISCCGERGLLGIAFHPRYAANRFFFVDYTNTSGNTVIAVPGFGGQRRPGGSGERRHPPDDRAAFRQPQRRAAPVRPGRLPLHRDGRRRLGQRPVLQRAAGRHASR